MNVNHSHAGWEHAIVETDRDLAGRCEDQVTNIQGRTLELFTEKGMNLQGESSPIIVSVSASQSGTIGSEPAPCHIVLIPV